MYAFGIPLLISGIAATLDHMRTNAVTEDTYFQPRFCESEYWFAGLYPLVSNPLAKEEKSNFQTNILALTNFTNEKKTHTLGKRRAHLRKCN